MLVNFGDFSVDVKYVISVEKYKFGNHPENTVSVRYRSGKSISSHMIENTTVKKITDKINRVLKESQRSKK